MTDATCLELVSLAPEGKALHLQPGDRLVRINGLPFTGSAADLGARFAAATPLALTFRRDERELTLLAPGAALGLWQAVPAPAPAEARRLHPEALRNWEVMAAADGRYDLQPLPAPLLALAAAPVWMLQMRLWGLVAALAAAVALSLAVSPWLAAGVHLLASLHVWRAGAAYVRADRRLRGLEPAAVLAARGEAEAHAAWLALEPRGRFLFARAPAEPAPASA